MKTTEINGVHPQTVRRYLRAMGIECPTRGPGNGFDITDDMARHIKAIHALLGDSNSVPTNGVSVSMEQAIALTKPARHLHRPGRHGLRHVGAVLRSTSERMIGDQTSTSPPPSASFT